MSDSSHKILGGIAVCVFLAIYLFQITRGTGPLHSLYAERLLERTYAYGTHEAIEVIAPDGELAEAHYGNLENITAIDCPKTSSNYGRISRVNGRTYGGARFQCLFVAESRSGARLYFSTGVHRTTDPAGKGSNDGHSLWPQVARDTRSLMTELGRSTRPDNSEEQRELWASLATDDIYVPADKTQISPSEKASREYLKKLVPQLYGDAPLQCTNRQFLLAGLADRRFTVPELFGFHRGPGKEKGPPSGGPFPSNCIRR